MRCYLSNLLLTAGLVSMVQPIALAQTLESTLQRQDPAAYRTLQNAMPSLEKMGVNLQNLRDGRRVDQELQNMQRDVESKLQDRDRSVYKEAQDFVKQPNVSQSKSPPTGLHMPVYRGNDATYTRADLRLNSFQGKQGMIPESVTITATETPDRVISWYRTALRNDGWRVTEAPGSRMGKGYVSASFNCEKKGWTCSVQVFGRSTGPRVGSQISATAIMDQGDQ